MKTKVQARGNELIMTRDFDAPKKLVFETYSDCKHLMNWWGPRTWPLNYCKMDFRVDGKWHYCMKGPNQGDESWGMAVYKEIKVPDRIVYEDYFSDQDGNLNRSMPAAHITCEFTEKGGKTTLTAITKYPNEDDLQKVMDMGVVAGMNETLDRLEELLATL